MSGKGKVSSILFYGETHNISYHIEEKSNFERQKVFFWYLGKEKIILRETESAFLVPWKRKIVLHYIEKLYKIPWSAVPWNDIPWKKISLLCRITDFLTGKIYLLNFCLVNFLMFTHFISSLSNIK
jgi:hypothetical protein